MADIKISQLPAATLPLTGAELVPVVQGGVTKQVASDKLGFLTGSTDLTYEVIRPGGGAQPSLMIGSVANTVAATTGAAFVFGGTTSFPQSLGAASELSVIGGGYDNAIGDTASASIIAGGAHHQIANNASHGAILGGSYQTIKGSYGFCGAGTQNTVESSFSVVCGGQSNVAGLAGAPDTLVSRSSFVGGGSTNTASGLRSAIVGGFTNTATAQESFVGGGTLNDATGTQSCVLGGNNNNATAQYATVIGGALCNATGTSSGVGGDTAVASNSYAWAFGEFLEAAGPGSIATGIRAYAALRGQRSHAAGYFAARGDAQISDLVARCTTTGATPQVLDLNGGTANKIVLPNNTTWGFVATVTARRADADNENAFYELKGAIKRDANEASTAIVGVVTKTVVAEDTAAWDIAATADTTNGALAITCTGEAGKTVRWVGRIALTEVSG